MTTAIEPAAWRAVNNDGSLYGEPQRWPPLERAREYHEGLGRTIQPLYASQPEAPEGEARKVEWVNDASNVNDRRMYIDGQQWAKVYGWDKASLDARCDALQAAMQRTAAPSADKLRIAVEALDEARENLIQCGDHFGAGQCADAVSLLSTPDALKGDAKP